jgi:regulatory protein
VKLLVRREHTRAELVRKLAAHGTPEEIDIVLNELARNGLQSDARFAECYVRSQTARLGAARLRQALRSKGVAPELIEQQVIDLPDEAQRALAIWQKKFAAAPVDAREWAKQARFLQGRGFSSAIIRQLLREVDS